MCTVTPVNYWPKGKPTTNIDMQTRQEIMLSEHLRQIDQRLTALEKKK